MKKSKEIHWKQYCESCKKNHIVYNGPCLTCSTYTVVMPVSEKVQDTCKAKYQLQCDGCEAYNDHY